MPHFWWGCRGNLKLLTRGSERVKLTLYVSHTQHCLCTLPWVCCSPYKVSTAVRRGRTSPRNSWRTAWHPTVPAWQSWWHAQTVWGPLVATDDGCWTSQPILQHSDPVSSGEVSRATPRGICSKRWMLWAFGLGCDQRSIPETWRPVCALNEMFRDRRYG